MKKKSAGGKPKYSNSFKIAVAREYLSGSLSSRELSEKYDLPYSDTAHYFVRWYKEHYPNGLQDEGVASEIPLEISDAHKSLTTQLKDANLKIAGLEMMIEIAQKELGIDIRKKSGTKRSQK
jgi:transposase-like protein